MVLGALIGLGLSVRALEQTLRQVVLRRGWFLRAKRVERWNWPAWKVDVVGDQPFGTPAQMAAAVRRGRLPSPVRRKALAALETLFRAEASAHGVSTQKLTLKGKIGHLDTLIDIVGSLWGFHQLGIEAVRASPLSLGIVAPATAVLLRSCQIPVQETGRPEELSTPTGVAILSQVAKDFGPLPLERVARAGYGAGACELPDRPNVVVLLQGIGKGTVPLSQEGQSPFLSPSLDRLVLLETNIDDMDPRLYPHICQRLLEEGAKDVWLTSTIMKKGRPGILLSALSDPLREPPLLRLLFEETTTLGVRRLPVERWALRRIARGTRKIALLPGGSRKIKGEFEKVRVAARHRRIPLRRALI